MSRSTPSQLKYTSRPTLSRCTAAVHSALIDTPPDTAIKTTRENRKQRQRDAHTTKQTRVVPIEEIRLGDRVWAWDEARQQRVVKPVKRLFLTPAKQARTLYYHTEFGQRESVRATEEHPFFVVGKGWVALNQLHIDDVLQLKSGERAKVGHVGSAEPTETVFNFEVQGSHNYFVGESGVLVHNSSIKASEDSNIISPPDDHIEVFDRNEVLRALATAAKNAEVDADARHALLPPAPESKTNAPDSDVHPTLVMTQDQFALLRHHEQRSARAPAPIRSEWVFHAQGRSGKALQDAWREHWQAVSRFNRLNREFEDGKRFEQLAEQDDGRGIKIGSGAEKKAHEAVSGWVRVEVFQIQEANAKREPLPGEVGIKLSGERRDALNVEMRGQETLVPLVGYSKKLQRDVAYLPRVFGAPPTLRKGRLVGPPPRTTNDIKNRLRFGVRIDAANYSFITADHLGNFLEHQRLGLQWWRGYGDMQYLIGYYADGSPAAPLFDMRGHIDEPQHALPEFDPKTHTWSSFVALAPESLPRVYLHRGEFTGRPVLPLSSRVSKKQSIYPFTLNVPAVFSDVLGIGMPLAPFSPRTPHWQLGDGPQWHEKLEAALQNPDIAKQLIPVWASNDRLLAALIQIAKRTPTQPR